MMVWPMGKSTQDQRINELEARVAFQDDTIGALNDALVTQQIKIAQLEKSLELLIGRYREAGAEPEPPTFEEPPPHY